MLWFMLITCSDCTPGQSFLEASSQPSFDPKQETNRLSAPKAHIAWYWWNEYTVWLGSKLLTHHKIM